MSVLNLTCRAGVVGLACSLLLMAGCGGDKLHKISGTVKYKDGGKLSQGRVFFAGEEATDSGQINKDGTYELEEGIPAGKYKVYVISQEEVDLPDPTTKSDAEGPAPETSTQAAPEPKSFVKEEYTLSDLTPLEFTAGDKDTYDVVVEKP